MAEDRSGDMIMTSEVQRAEGPVAPEEGLTERGGRVWYTVPDVDRMAPFLMSVVSDGDRWMFASSTGALTAGRRDAAGALFPYETDDRLHAAAGQVGAVTRMRVRSADGTELDQWVPFTDVARPPGRRWISKSIVGDTVEFAEEHAAASLVFRSRWATSEQHGFVRTAELTNHGTGPVRIELVDGLLGVMPPGIDPVVQQRYSNLANAYKRSEQLGGPGRLAVYSLEAPVSDLAEPREVLRSTVVWSTGLPGAAVSLDPAAPDAFDDDLAHPTAVLVTGRRGAYLLRDSIEVTTGQTLVWRIVADVGLDHLDLVELHQRLGSTGAPATDAGIGAGIERTHRRLTELMAGADAQQYTGDAVACAHHLANVTYNVMRGGLPLDGHQVDTADLARFVQIRNREVARRHAAWFAGLPSSIERRTLLGRAAEVGDPHLERLVRDDLPFSFSRRHGDPSRPWNAFSIRVQDDEGRPVVHYEGNWRDVFQNWEALCESYPEYLPGVVSVFVNSSTPDGHNPYRITRDGIDWEVPDPDDPWANIGYWGDHQLIYLLRLLRATDQVSPGELDRLLPERAFTYADVPYRIVGHDEMVSDPKNTIRFDADADERVRARMAELGGDGALVPAADGFPVLVTLIEKLLVTALAKVSNFVPGGGIWMNTQRPEWNDANNALVGHGLSMVTLFHLRQFLEHLRGYATVLDAPTGGDPGPDAEIPVTVSAEVAVWLDEVLAVLRDESVPAADTSPDALAVHRRTVLGRLGRVAAEYRSGVADGFTGVQAPFDRDAVVELCDRTIAHLDATIRANRRDDGLFHSYNLLELHPDGHTATVRHLPEMLEGQVAALGSGALTPAEQADLIDSLFASRLHRADIDTFLLAPAQVPPSFLDKNRVPETATAAGSLLGELIASGERSIVRRDATGQLRFHPELVDARSLDLVLDRLAADDRWREQVERDRGRIHELFEEVFGHRAHLGRSGSMYAYEGIGSVYWHMVTKLLLAVQEAASDAADQGTDTPTLARFVAGYWRVRDGLGVNRSAHEFGAIPTDPYSHTPAHAGAQQPGMTGAVKEELLTRRRELGVRIVDGDIEFDDLLLREVELLERPADWSVTAVDGRELTVEIPPGCAGLAVCQVPVVVGRGVDGPYVEVRTVDGRTVRRPGARLGREPARAVFARTGEIEMICAVLPMR